MESGIFSHSFRLYYNDFDRYGRVRVSTLLHILSDVAGIHYAERGYGYEWLKEHAQVFLLSAVRFQMFSNPERDEKLEIRTWENGTKGAAFVRCFCLYGADGRKILEAASNWMLVNPESRKLLRPRDFVGEVIPVEREIGDVFPQRLKGDLTDLTMLSERVVRFTDMDQNDHVYNAKYADMIWDALPQEYVKGKLSDFQIHYQKEAVLGDTLRIGFCTKEDGILIVGLLDQTTDICFTAKIRLGV